MRLLERFWSGDRIQLTFSTKPHVSPVLVATRAKGRLQHALRKVGHPQKFSRKLSVSSVGDNTIDQVEAYIAKQVPKATFVDPMFASTMRKFTISNADVDLAQPNESARGRYWYNVHLVLVVHERCPIVDVGQLTIIRDGCLSIATQNSYGISWLSVMPDHVHLALRGDHEYSPEAIALKFQNNLAFMFGETRVWRETYYVGTFGKYNMWAIRNNPSPESCMGEPVASLAAAPDSPSGKPDGASYC